MTIRQRIEQHPAVVEVSDERDSGDGIWVYYLAGWKSESDPVGVLHSDHEDTWTEVWERVRGVLPCDCVESTEGGLTCAAARAKVPPPVRVVQASRVAQAREQKEQGRGGRFGRLNPCYGCGKSAGKNYFSHPMTDVGWGDLALCLCARCAAATEKMIDPLDFLKFAVERGGMTAERAEIIRKAEMLNRGEVRP